jgi:sulfonate transport system substrate-binding protein
LKKSKLSVLMLGLMLILSAVLTSCSTGSGEETSKKDNTTPDTKQTIRIGYQKNGPLIIMKNRGTLEKRLEPMGVSVEWFEFQAGPPLLEALNAGSIDFGRTGDSPPIFAQASGSSLVYVAVGNPKSKGSGILVKQDSPIKSLEDLKGKTIGFAKGSSSHFFLVKALEKAGLTLNDIKPAYLSPGDARVAFEQSKIDAWIVWDPFTADAEKTAGARVLLNGDGLTSDRDFFLADSDYADKHKDILKAVVEEIQASCEWANDNQEELADMLSTVLKIDKATMKLAVERRVYGLVDIDSEIIKEQQSIADTFYDLKIIPNKVNIEDRVYKLN